MKYEANLVVIGAGSAGLVSAYIAAAVKAKVILIEKNAMGGDCLNTGCVPSKALIKAAKVAHQSRTSEKFGIRNSETHVDFEKVMAHVHEAIKEIEPHDSVERYTSLGVECVQGDAKILSPHCVKVGDREITTRNIIVATGAGPFVPSVNGIDKVEYLTSDNLWQLDELPKNLLVMGAGPIGCELAQAFSRLGSKVSVVDLANKVLPRADEDVSDEIKKIFDNESVSLYLNSSVESLEENKAVITCGGVNKEIVFDKLLVAVGRKPNTQGFGLEELNVRLNQNGTIAVDEYLRSNVSSILACGDVAGPYQFTHAASHQAWYASVNALVAPFKRFKVDYSIIPWVIFTDPEVAHVGASEIELQEKNIPYEVYKYDISDLDRAIAEKSNSGFVKVMLKKGKDKILGVTIVSANAGEMLPEFVTAMKHNKGLNTILGTIHSYPTWGEANKYSAGVWKKANAPQGLLRLAEKFHRWRR